jgi:hypothetical protein
LQITFGRRTEAKIELLRSSLRAQLGRWHSCPLSAPFEFQYSRNARQCPDSCYSNSGPG